MPSIPKTLTGIRKEIDYRLCLRKIQLVLDSSPTVPTHWRRPVPIEDDLRHSNAVQTGIGLHPRPPVGEIADHHPGSPANPAHGTHYPMPDPVMRDHRIR